MSGPLFALFFSRDSVPCFYVTTKGGKFAGETFALAAFRRAAATRGKTVDTNLIILIIVLLVLFGGGGGYFWSRRGV